MDNNNYLVDNNFSKYESKLLRTFKFIKKALGNNFDFGPRADVENWMINKFKRFSIPSVEVGGLHMIYRVFPEFKDKLPREANINHQIVKDKDLEEIDVYCREKRFKYESLNHRFLAQTIIYMAGNIGMLSKFDYYSIDDNETVYSILPKETSSGYPLYIHKGTEEARSHCNALIRQFLSLKRTGQKLRLLYENFTTIFHRFTPKLTSNKKKEKYTVNYKIRQILGVPLFICALEVKYLFSFVDAFKDNLKDYYTIGCTRTEISERINAMRNLAASKSKVIMSGDIKS